MTTTKTLSRRALLRGAGVSLALPVLESLGCDERERMPVAPAPPVCPPMRVEYRPTATRRRLVFFHVPNGFVRGRWTPASEGAGFALSPTLAPLEPHRSELLVVSGLSNQVTYGTGAFHTRAMAGALTCVPVDKHHVRVGVSVDQVAAQALSGATRLPSLELSSAAEHEGAVSCDGDWGCVYGDHLSWAAPDRPVPRDSDPRRVFDRVFGAGGVAGEAFARRQRLRRSLLDNVLDDLQAMNARASAGDRRRLDAYTTSIRELERQLERMATAAPAGAARPGEGLGLAERLQAMIDLTTLALQSDATRVVSLMHGYALFAYDYSEFLPVPRGQGHHGLSHHAGDPVKIEAQHRIGVWEVEQLARLLGRLRAVEEPDGTLLDNTVVCFLSDLHAGNDHVSLDLPVVLAGRGGGALRPGRHLRFTAQEPLADLYVSLLATVGVTVDRFGATGSGALPGLLG
ncbi:MAG: DUF1552 domain-containing protein [Deltaproteobacteria bacterium]|nr:DUF1552 domain-containing protein [Deltaproteobacteria bacterium]